MHAIVRTNYTTALSGLNGHRKQFTELALKLVPESHISFVVLNMPHDAHFDNAKLQQERKEIRKGKIQIFGEKLKEKVSNSFSRGPEGSLVFD